MQLLVLFGLPGTGKTYVGNILQKDFGFFLHDGDTDLPKDMQEALTKNAVISDEMRDRFFQNIIITTKELLFIHDKLVITQTFIKEKYRKQFLRAFPHAQFILINTPTTLREKRLNKRKDYPLDEAYAQNMVRMFEKPHIPHKQLINDTEGKEKIKTQLIAIFQ